MTDENPSLEAIAYHEAGHAVAVWAVHRPIHRVSIIPDEEQGSFGHTKWRGIVIASDTSWFAFTARQLGQLQETIIVLLAGMIAEQKYRRAERINIAHSSSDAQEAIEIIQRVTGSTQEASKLLEWLWFRAVNVIDLHWPAVEAVAAHLLKRRKLGRRKVFDIILQAIVAQGRAAADSAGHALTAGAGGAVSATGDAEAERTHRQCKG